MGTPQFSVPSLLAISKLSFATIKLVVTSPDKPRRSQNSEPIPTPVKLKARELGLDVLEVEDVKDPEFAKTITTYNPDVIVVVAFRILPEQVFSIPTKGTFNLHASLLPKFRGAAPINWAIMKGEQKTGVTTFFIEKKVDTGEMILQKELSIGSETTATQLAEELSVIGAEAVAESLEQIHENRVQLQIQDSSLASKAPKLFKDNTRIEWNRHPEDVVNFIRGLAERPTAWTEFDGKMVKLFKASVSDEPASNISPGTWLVENGRLKVACLNGAIEVNSLQMEGKKRLQASDFLRGYRLQGNERFD
jgi:methionyl-tRNA formyltransferase